MEDTNRFIHLTNDAVQMQSPDYGRFECGNKLTYENFQKVLKGRANFSRDMLPRMKRIVKDTIIAVYKKMEMSQSFEILGYDFLVDSEFKVWLLEVSSNPCLETNSPVLSKIIPAMVENSLRIALDPMFHVPTKVKSGSNQRFFENRYELIFHSKNIN